VTATRRLAAILAADVAGYSRLMWAESKGPAKGRSKPKSSMPKIGAALAPTELPLRMDV
jgi:hypothetical protein